jgi:uncharacterized membrane protein YqhA
MNPDRSFLYFIEGTAIFSSIRWLRIVLWGTIPVALLLFFTLLAISILTFIQEIFPTLRNIFPKGQEEEIIHEADSETDFMVSELSNIMNIDKPTIYILNNDNPFIYPGLFIK